MGVSCTKTQLLALLIKLEEDVLEACKREIETEDIHTCIKIVAPISALKVRLKDLSVSEVLSSIY